MLNSFTEILKSGPPGTKNNVVRFYGRRDADLATKVGQPSGDKSGERCWPGQRSKVRSKLVRRFALGRPAVIFLTATCWCADGSRSGLCVHSGSAGLTPV